MNDAIDKKADAIFELIDQSSRDLSDQEWRALLYRLVAGCNDRISESHEER